MKDTFLKLFAVETIISFLLRLQMALSYVTKKGLIK